MFVSRSLCLEMMLVGAEKFAKVVGGKEKDVVKLYVLDADAWDYMRICRVGWGTRGTSEENTST